MATLFYALKIHGSAPKLTPMVATTYRTYGAETSGPMAAIDMLLRWSKVYVLDVVLYLTFVQSNLHDEPISYIELTLK